MKISGFSLIAILSFLSRLPLPCSLNVTASLCCHSFSNTWRSSPRKIINRVGSSVPLQRYDYRTAIG